MTTEKPLTANERVLLQAVADHAQYGGRPNCWASKTGAKLEARGLIKLEPPSPRYAGAYGVTGCWFLTEAGKQALKGA